LDKRACLLKVAIGWPSLVRQLLFIPH